MLDLSNTQKYSSPHAFIIVPHIAIIARIYNYDFFWQKQAMELALKE